MKAIMVMYDSLTRKYLEPYGCDSFETPNFKRLRKHCVTFDKNYVGSMPCMPARRELHTGRLNFEHRSWGPIEPFDDSMPEILKKNNIFTYLSTDHDHYWEDGGATYHQRYSAFDFSRGQEADPWKVNKELMQSCHENNILKKMKAYDNANREYMNCEERMPQAVTFKSGLDFINNFHGEDNWFLQIETFDPHEPFFTQKEYREAFKDDYKGQIDDWPPYYFVTEGQEAVNHVRNRYKALITMCDRYLGKVLDLMDKYNLWEDTMLIVNTDHGFLIGEHDWWAKSMMPLYEEISHTPLFVYDPRFKEKANTRSDKLTQTIDIAPTVLEFFNLPVPEDMEGKPLRNIIEKDEKIRDYALFGFHDGHVNITDGHYVYMRAPLPNTDFYEYTLMPTHMRALFSNKELKTAELTDPFSFTKGLKVLKIKAEQGMNDPANFGSKLFNLDEDPNEENLLTDYKKEAELANEMVKLMKEDDCPEERYGRFGLNPDGNITEEDIIHFREREEKERIPETLNMYQWDRGAANMYVVFKKYAPKFDVDAKIKEIVPLNQKITIDVMKQLFAFVPKEILPILYYIGMLYSRTV